MVVKSGCQFINGWFAIDILASFEQFSQNCESCAKSFASYFCGECKLLIEKKVDPYHCNDCGICRYDIVLFIGFPAPLSPTPPDQIFETHSQKGFTSPATPPTPSPPLSSTLAPFSSCLSFTSTTSIPLPSTTNITTTTTWLPLPSPSPSPPPPPPKPLPSPILLLPPPSLQWPQ